MNDEAYMSRALELAKEALFAGEVPVGCVIVGPDGSIVGEGRNRREQERDALGHAELAAIRMACQTLGGWRLSNTRLYVTLEPCPMCACGSVLNLFEESFGFHPRIFRGPLEAECSHLLSDFFAQTRRKI